MSSRTSLLERLTPRTDLNDFEPPASLQRSEADYSKGPGFYRHEECGASRYAYNGQHEEARRWTGGGGQQAVHEVRRDGRYFRGSNEKFEGAPSRLQPREWRANHWFQFAHEALQYVPPLPAQQYGSTERSFQRFNSQTLDTDDEQRARIQQRWRSFDPNVAPFVPQQRQQTQNESVRYLAYVGEPRIDGELRHEPRKHFGQPWNGFEPIEQASVTNSHSNDKLSTTTIQGSEAITKLAGRLTKDPNLAYATSLSRKIVPGRVTQSITQSRKKSTPRLYLLTKPSPTTIYLNQTQKTLVTLAHPQKLLVIVDLNGTLLARSDKHAAIVRRPGVKDFLEYLFSNHKVMVWSSARAENVYKMCEQLFTPQQLQQLVAIWSRDMLRLGRFHHSNVQVYKNLDWIWEVRAIQATATSPYLPWTQHNTVLVDDTSAKAASQPFNLINVEEFEKRPEQMHSDVLHQVVTYLDTLSWQDNVSAYMRAMPFQPNKR